jgi:hypothetical protein
MSTYHIGSAMSSPISMPLGLNSHLHGRTNEHILSALAIGPKVPRRRGNAVLANHSCLKHGLLDYELQSFIRLRKSTHPRALSVFLRESSSVFPVIHRWPPSFRVSLISLSFRDMHRPLPMLDRAIAQLF